MKEEQKAEMKWTEHKVGDKLPPDGTIGVFCVSTDWCGPCKTMKSHVSEKLPTQLEKKLGKEWMERTRLFYMDGGKKENKSFKKDFEVACFPTWFAFYVKEEQFKFMAQNEGWDGRCMSTLVAELREAARDLEEEE